MSDILDFQDNEETNQDDLKLKLKKCSYCRHYITASNISRHIKLMHPNRMKKCKKTRDELRTQAKVFTCLDPCSYSSNRKENLDRHKNSRNCFHNMTHLCIFCTKIFTSENAFWRHLNNRECEKQFNCGICNSNYRTEKDLNKHLENCNILNS